ncbi:MAG: MATE family efflux transporter, partial [Novosphingobium sp.]
MAAARSLALTALAIGLGFGLLLSVTVLVLGPAIFRLMGGEGAVLSEAVAFAHIAAFAIVGIWASNTLASIARGSGTMAVPAVILLVSGLVQVAVGGTLALGLGPAPRLGIAGVAVGQL